ncbi:MAG: hypothetical protein JXB00_07200 [Bacteroidales bacterium]|nr:hypothetical protein [Bacteroidales bacterium]
MKTKKLFSSLLALTGVSVLFWQACIKDEIDFENISGMIEYNPELHAPVIRGSFTIADIYDAQDEDSVIVLRGDSIYVYIRQDSVYNFNVADFIEIPDQGSQHYDITSPPYDLVFATPQVYTLVQTDSFQITLENGMRLDSILTNSGTLVMDIHSTFSAVGALRITSPSLYMNGEPYDTIIQFSRASGDYQQTHSVPLQNAKLVVNNDNPDYSKMEVNFIVVVAMQAGETIKANSTAEIDFSIQDLNDFERAFGYAGDTAFAEDTIIDVDLGEIEGLSGTFAITNPKINFLYTHSFGLPIGFNLKVKGYFEDGDSVVLEPGMQRITISEDYTNPEVSSMLSFNRNNISNIDQFLVFPPPEQIGFAVNVQANPDGNTGAQNYILGNSQLLLGLEIEVPLEFRADLQFRDTTKLDIEDSEDVQYIEYANLHYRFRNEFPLNVGVTLILHDSISNVNVDTIVVNNRGDKLLLKAAAVDESGISLTEQVAEVPGVMELSSKEIENFFNRANKVIIIGELSSYNPETVSSVKILSTYSLGFKFNIETKIHYTGNIE